MPTQSVLAIGFCKQVRSSIFLEDREVGGMGIDAVDPRSGKSQTDDLVD